MALVVRYIDPKTGKYKRARTRLRPTGYFRTREEARKVELSLEKQGYKNVHIGGVSIPVPKPSIDYVNLSPSKGRNTARVILLHSTESHDRAGLSDVAGVLGYLESKGYGVHYVIDGDGNIGKGAQHRDMVYHVVGANSFSVGIEQIGFAKWSTSRWLRYPTGKARKQLREVAHLIAYIADREGIPIKRSTTHGVALHRDFPEGGHWDPGYGYPTAWVLREARKIRTQFRGTR